MYFSFRDNEIFVKPIWYVILAQWHWARIDVTLPLPWPVLYALPATCFVFALLLFGLVLFRFRSIKWSERHVEICFSLSSSGQISSALFSSFWQALPCYHGWCFSEKSRPCPADWLKTGADIAASDDDSPSIIISSCSGRTWGSFADISIQWGHFPPHFSHFLDTAKYVCMYTVVDFKLCKSANAHVHAQTNIKMHSDTTTNTMLKIQSDGFAFNTKEKICAVLELYKIDGLEAWNMRPAELLHGTGLVLRLGTVER